MSDLLPPNATPLERAIEATIATRLTLPTSLAGAAWNPESCPAHLLGHLAWQLSIDLWDEAWDEGKKRRVCRDALALHRIKGTLAGIKAHVALTGAQVVKTIRPPAKLFAVSGMTAAEREAWLNTLPQIRLYPFDRRPIASKRAFLSSAFARRFLARCYPTPSRGFTLTGTRATIWDRGIERDIAFSRPDADTLRLAIPRVTTRPFLGVGYWRRLYATPSAARGNTVTLRLSGDIGGFAVNAGLDPVSIEPTRVAQARTAPAARAFLGRAGRCWLLASAGPRQVYDRIALNDPTRIAARRRGRVFLGHARLGYVPFQAELRVAVPLTRSPWRAARFAGRGYLKAGDVSGVAAAARAVGVAKAARDTILLDTVTHRQVSFADGLTFGSFTFGEMRKAA